MAVRRLGLTRDQLASFLEEHEQIRQFELLFTAVDEIQTNGLDSVTYDAGAALSGVNKLAGVVAQLAQDGAIDASNALATAQAATRALEAIEALAMVGATAPPLVPKRRNVGAFHSMVDQAPLAINTAYPVTFDVVDIEQGIWRGAINTSRIRVADAGVYNFSFSVQVDKISGGPAHLYLWARVNGVDVPDTGSFVHVQGNNNETVESWNFLLTMAPNSYFELVYSADNLDVRLEHLPAAAPVPAIPSVILTVTQEG